MSDYLLIQLSDIHLSSEGSLFPGANPRPNLVASLRLLSEADLRPDLLILTGDLANGGEPDCYRDLADIMAHAIKEFGGKVVYLPGNHDERTAFRRHLLGQSPSSSPINQTYWLGELRVVLLDSVIEGHDAGELEAETLAYLRHAIETPAPDGTVLALHHPPVPSPVHPMARIMLRNPERLAEAIGGSDVRLIICGHNHHGMLGTLGSVPVWISPATVYEMDVLSQDAIRGVPGCSFSQINLTESGVTVSTISVPL